jgi:predicted transcriptional regulator
MKNPLSNNEFKIMQLLWKEGRSLSRPEIIELTPDKDWNPNSIHLILNNMIDKGVIRVDGMARCGRGYGRTYAACLTNVEYAVLQLRDATPELNDDERLLAVTGALIREPGVTDAGREALRSLI